MATSYTSLLGLALPVTGELSGTWGDTVNNAITSLLDTAVAGTTTLSADSDVTLTTTTGVANQARQAILLCSGARTAIRTITAPAQSKIYTVINATTGGYSVKVVGAGPTAGVTIVAGESAVIAWNGSDFIKISNTGGSASFTNVTVSGTTTLSGLTASTALALNASKEVVSVANTGTGNNVLSASPTLTGTVSGASLQLSSLTAGRVTYAGASGLLQDSANLTFDGTNLTVSGAVNAGTINATTLDLTNLEVTNIKAKDGTAAITIANTTGVVSLTANPVLSGGTANGVAYLNGSKVLTSGSALTFDGTNLGVGTNAPNANLEVLKSTEGQYMKVGGPSAGRSLTFTSATAGSSAGALHTIDASSGEGVIALATAGSERMRINAVGGVSIGTTTSPGAGGLYVAGNTTLGDASTDTVTVNGYMGVGGAATSTAAIAIASTALTGASQFGIIASPTANSSATSGIAGVYTQPVVANDTFTTINVSGVTAADVVKGASATITNQYGVRVADQTQGTNNYGILSAVSSGSNKWNIYANGTAANYFAGNVGIGTSSPGEKLTVSGNIAFPWISSGTYAFGPQVASSNSYVLSGVTLEIKGADAFAGANAMAGGDVLIRGGVGQPNVGLGVFSGDITLRAGATTSASDVGAGVIKFETGGTSAERMRIDSSGNVGIGTSSPSTPLHVYKNVNGPSTVRVENPNASNGAYANFVAVNDVGAGCELGISSSTRSSVYPAGEGFIYTGSGLNVGYSGATKFYAGTAERMRLDSSGNLGLGVTPSASWWASMKSIGVGRLGNGVFGTTNDDEINIGANVINTGSGTYIYGATDTASLYRQVAAQHVWYYAGSGTAGAALTLTEAMRINASGNVGIGTSSPSYLLQVGNATISSTLGVISDGTNGTALRWGGTGTGAGVLRFLGQSDAERMRLDASGNLGLGVTPSAWGSGRYLQVLSISSFGQQGNGSVNILSNAYESATNAFSYVQSSTAAGRYNIGPLTGHTWYNAASGTAGAAITFTQAMTLDTSGRLGIGTTAPRNILAVKGATTAGEVIVSSIWQADTNAGSSAAIWLSASGDSIDARGTKISAITNGSAGANSHSLTFSTSAPGAAPSERMRIDSAGNVQTLTGSQVVWAPAPASISTTATLTNANIQGQIINTTGTSYTVTMPLGTTLETLVSWAATDLGYNFTVINTASGTITMAVNTGVTSLGALTIATGTSAQFRIRRTAANTFVLYRMS